MCIWFHRTTVRLSWFFVQINILEGRAGYVVLMGRVSVTISYSSRCLTTETVKYTNEKFYWEFSFIKIQYVGTERETNVIINVLFAFSEEELPCVQKCKQVCVSKLLCAKNRRSEDRHSMRWNCSLWTWFSAPKSQFSLYSIFQILSDGFKLTDNVMEFVDHAVMNLNSVLSFPFIREFNGEEYNFCGNDINEDCLSHRI